MFTKFRKLSVILSILFAAVAVLIRVELGAELNRYEEEIENLSRRISGYEKEVAELQREKNDAEEMLREVESYLSEHLLGGKYRNLSVDQFASILKIYDNTPLSLEAAAAVVYYADYYGIRYSLILSVIEIESNFNQYLVGTSEDRGYMQIIPITEKYLVEAFGEEIGISYDPNRIFEPDYNLGLGISYIAYLYDRHGDDPDKILTEYNRGAGGLAAYYRANATYSSTYSRAVIDRQEKYFPLENGSIRGRAE